VLLDLVAEYIGLLVEELEELDNLLLMVEPAEVPVDPLLVVEIVLLGHLLYHLLQMVGKILEVEEEVLVLLIHQHLHMSAVDLVVPELSSLLTQHK
jgi:hypothetical protein